MEEKKPEEDVREAPIIRVESLLAHMSKMEESAQTEMYGGLWAALMDSLNKVLKNAREEVEIQPPTPPPPPPPKPVVRTPPLVKREEAYDVEDDLLS
jgi:hypothetical protein